VDLPNVIEIEDLHYRFPDGTPALHGITLSVREGEHVGVLGANGAGKTTLLLHLNGILRGANGAVKVCGEPVSRRTIKQVRRTVGLVFQDPDDQLFCPTVYEDVAFGPRNMGLDSEQVDGRVEEALREVGMEGSEKRSAFHISAGEKKRVALATVLAMDSRILAFDEPASNLDPRGRRELIELLEGVSRTLVLATHDLDLVRRLCTRVVVLFEGKVVADGEVASVLADEDFLRSHGLA